MATKLVTAKFDEKFLKEIDAFLKASNYANRTEFMRDAMRCQMLSVDEKVKRMHELIYSTKPLPKITWKQYRKVRESNF